MALLVAFTPLFNIVLILAFGTLVAGILRAQVPSLATRYISELSAFHDALLPTIGFGLVFLLPDVLDILVAVTRRYGKAVIRGATALNDEAATVGRLTVFLAVVLDFTVDVPFVRSFHAAEPSEPPTTTPGPLTWPTYVVGTVAQYMPDLPSEGCVLELSLAFASNLPVGAGLSSSAALEVATATLLECFFKDDLAYSSLVDDDLHLDRTVVRALRCQKAENDWANSPCGIMDQFASSAAQSGQLMLIDCRSMEVSHVPMKTGPDQPVILVTNSQVGHEIADSEYGLRRKECNDALQAMQQVPLYHVLSLRDATLQDVDTAKEIMGETAFHRAKHVVTENSRTMECKTALKLGLWERVGELMNASHKSLKEEYEVSCDEVNFLVDICQDHPGVYGSRITGGGFGGCIVTLVQKEHVHDLIEKLQNDYKEVLGKECDSFITHPSFGSTVLAIDMDFKP